MDALPDFDVAVVGGGVGGIYTGWRLLTSPLAGSRLAGWETARGKLKVALFEGSDRIGGRLLSARSPHLPNTTAEAGGMRYVAPAQALITGLVERVLNLRWHKQTVDVQGNIAFLRGRLLRTSDLGKSELLPYALDPSEAAWLAARQWQVGQSPAGFIGRVLTKLMPELEAHLEAGTLRKYLSTISVDGLPLWRHGLWNLLAKGMSPDGYNAARATVGYDCLGGNTNALDLTAEYYDFTPSVSYRMVNVGYEAVPWELRGRFEKAGGELQLRQWLSGFVGIKLGDGSQGVEMRFQNGTTKTARALVLAMPRRSIERLKPEGKVLGPANKRFRQDLASVEPIPLFKAFLLYPSCWWQDAGVTAGRSLTDLPIRQCYYWPTGRAGTAVPPRNGPGLVMVYDDLLNVSFWEGLDRRSEVHKAGLPLSQKNQHHDWPLFKRKAPSDRVSPGADPFARRLLDNWEGHSATRQMVRELHRQLMLMHGIDSAPEPIDAAFMDWSRDPYGGGVHLWNVNVRSDEILHRMTQPVDDFPCYICGEAYSTNQTWAEGALQTAEIVLQQRLGLPKGKWQHG